MSSTIFADQSAVVDEYDGPDIRTEPGGENARVQGPPKPWLMVWFRCCHTYGRLNRNREQTAYTGCCPKCGTRVGAKIGPGGTSRRMFRAG